MKRSFRSKDRKIDLSRNLNIAIAVAITIPIPISPPFLRFAASRHPKITTSQHRTFGHRLIQIS
jgi:hypothetical protein